MKYTAERYIYILCCKLDTKKKFDQIRIRTFPSCGPVQKVFLFCAQFNSTHNFTQSGWPILFFPELFPGQQKLGKLPNTPSLAEQRRPVQTSHWSFFNSSSSMDTWGNLSNLWISCVYISLRPRNPSWIWIRYIQYATHRNNLMSPPKLYMSMRCLIPLSAPSSHFTSEPL